MKTRVFVYGSLLQGLSNHHVLDGAEYLGVARTTARFDLVDLGAYPGLLEAGSTAITGELYEVEERTLAALDRLEGTPNFYQRIEIQLADRSSAQAYVLSRAKYGHLAKVTSGYWPQHLRTRGNASSVSIAKAT